MQVFTTTNFNFIGNRNKAFVLSGLLLAATLVSLIVRQGPNWSIDFAGGTLIQLAFEKPIRDDLGTIRTAVAELGYGAPEIKTIGPADAHEVQIIVKKQREGAAVADEIKQQLTAKYPDNSFSLRRQEKVGPKIGGELQQKALYAILLSLLAIVVYVGLRFKLPYGIAAIIALFHDVAITIGVFSFVNAEVSLPIVAALLTIVGYSLNDTIVVFDRIRESLQGPASKRSFEDRINSSINQCLSRTIITSVTTFLVVVTIYIVFFTSGDVLKDFALALLVGVVVGTYSSMFIASPVLVLWNARWPIKS